MLKKKTWLASMRTIMDQNNGQFLLARISVLILIFFWLESGKGFLKSFAHIFLFIGLHQWIKQHTMYSAGVQVIHNPRSYCQSVIMWRTVTHEKIQSIFYDSFLATEKGMWGLYGVKCCITENRKVGCRTVLGCPIV